jgi:tRNA(Leu) C34 or U34 (ribose-2'-O)-methylase TrmL
MTRGYTCIGLHRPRSSKNLGVVLRSAGSFAVDLIAVAGLRYGDSRPDVRKQYRHTPLLQVEDLSLALPYACVAVAVDLLEDATPLPEYRHPERAFYVFGPEDGTLDETVTAWCRDRVYVPTRRCLNLAAAVNIVLYDRLVKRGRAAA